MSVAPTLTAAPDPVAVPAATHHRLLRTALKLDAVVSGANGLALLALAGPLEDLLRLPAASLRAAGAFLVVYGALVWAVGTRARLRPAAVSAVIAANAVWVIGSVLLLLAGWSDSSIAGSVWLGLQAATVTGFAAVQAVGRRWAQVLTGAGRARRRHEP